jgi:hypothetical protein
MMPRTGSLALLSCPDETGYHEMHRLQKRLLLQSYMPSRWVEKGA